MPESVVLILCLFFSWLVGFAAYIWRDHAQWKRVYEMLARGDKERRDLLNRLMARDFAQFVQAEATEKYSQALQQMLREEAAAQEEVGV